MVGHAPTFSPGMRIGRFDSEIESSFTHYFGESMCHDGSKLALMVHAGSEADGGEGERAGPATPGEARGAACPGRAYPNDFRRDAEAGELQGRYLGVEAEALETLALRVAVAGRLMARRVMGKSSFADLQDASGRIQLLVRRDELPEGAYAEFRQWDIGDIVGVRGTVFRTRTGELSVRASEIRLLAKCLRPLPEKWHGLGDTELRYRRRYVDLITSETTRETFRRRSRAIDLIRSFFVERGFLEVETPMMQSLPGGAIARPFRTHHHALGMDMYLRVAPELNLKRLVVGGFERVFEINRNFRNEGVSTEHNPEFTMLEFYQAHADYQDMMGLTESLLRELAPRVTGSSELDYQGERIDFGPPFARTTLRDACFVSCRSSMRRRWTTNPRRGRPRAPSGWRCPTERAGAGSGWRSSRNTWSTGFASLPTSPPTPRRCPRSRGATMPTPSSRTASSSSSRAGR